MLDLRIAMGESKQQFRNGELNSVQKSTPGFRDKEHRSAEVAVSKLPRISRSKFERACREYKDGVVKPTDRMYRLVQIRLCFNQRKCTKNGKLLVAGGKIAAGKGSILAADGGISAGDGKKSADSFRRSAKGGAIDNSDGRLDKEHVEELDSGKKKKKRKKEGKSDSPVFSQSKVYSGAKIEERIKGEVQREIVEESKKSEKRKVTITATKLIDEAKHKVKRQRLGKGNAQGDEKVGLIDEMLVNGEVGEPKYNQRKRQRNQMSGNAHLEVAGRKVTGAANGDISATMKVSNSIKKERLAASAMSQPEASLANPLKKERLASSSTSQAEVPVTTSIKKERLTTSNTSRAEVSLREFSGKEVVKKTRARAVPMTDSLEEPELRKNTEKDVKEDSFLQNHKKEELKGTNATRNELKTSELCIGSQKRETSDQVGSVRLLGEDAAITEVQKLADGFDDQKNEILTHESISANDTPIVEGMIADKSSPTSVLTEAEGNKDPKDLNAVPEKPPSAWVQCDKCTKWRQIPVELAEYIDITNPRWCCRDNLDKAFADCSVPQEKSDAEINAELNISESSNFNENDNSDGQVDSKALQKSHSQVAQKYVWTSIERNVYVNRCRKSPTIDEIMICQCKAPEDGTPGCCGDDCLNRSMNIECVPGTCPCGDLCCNQRFQKKVYAKVKEMRCGKKGYGLRVLEDVPRMTFIIEYVGEVLGPQEHGVRLKEYACRGHKHSYFMKIENEYIDARAKGNLARFINHSCDPNCYIEKFNVNGEVCIGFFAKRDLVKVAETRFASHTIVLRRLVRVKEALCQMVISNKWGGWKQVDTEKAKIVKDLIFSDDFWNRVEYALELTEPLMSMLRYADTDEPCLGNIYDAMDSMLERMKSVIQRREQDPDTLYSTVEKIVLHRWNKMTTPLHLLAYALSPRYYSSEILDIPGRVPPYRDPEVAAGYKRALNRLFSDPDVASNVRREFVDFVSGKFAEPDAINDQSRLDAIGWWYLHGERYMYLQPLAIKILSQGEELTADYNFQPASGAAAEKCACGSANCRGFIGDFKNPTDVVENESDGEEPLPIMVKEESEDVATVVDCLKSSLIEKTQDWHESKIEVSNKVQSGPLVKKLLAVSSGDGRRGMVKKLKRSKTVSTSEKSGTLNSKGLGISGYFDGGNNMPLIQVRKVQDILSEMLDVNGGIVKRRDVAKHYLKLLVVTAASGDANDEASGSTRDLSMVLDALLKTKSHSLLVDIANKNGFQLLHNMIKQHHKFPVKIPIIRKLLRILHLFAVKKIFTSEQMRSIPSREGVESFEESIWKLTRHENPEVQKLARQIIEIWDILPIRKSFEVKQSPRGPSLIKANNQTWRKDKLPLNHKASFSIKSSTPGKPEDGATANFGQLIDEKETARVTEEKEKGVICEPGNECNSNEPNSFRNGERTCNLGDSRQSLGAEKQRSDSSSKDETLGDYSCAQEQKSFPPVNVSEERQWLQGPRRKFFNKNDRWPPRYPSSQKNMFSRETGPHENRPGIAGGTHTLEKKTELQNGVQVSTVPIVNSNQNIIMQPAPSPVGVIPFVPQENGVGNGLTQAASPHMPVAYGIPLELFQKLHGLPVCKSVDTSAIRGMQPREFGGVMSATPCRIPCEHFSMQQTTNIVRPFHSSGCSVSLPGFPPDPRTLAVPIGAPFGVHPGLRPLPLHHISQAPANQIQRQGFLFHSKKNEPDVLDQDTPEPEPPVPGLSPPRLSENSKSTHVSPSFGSVNERNKTSDLFKRTSLLSNKNKQTMPSKNEQGISNLMAQDSANTNFSRYGNEMAAKECSSQMSAAVDDMAGHASRQCDSFSSPPCIETSHPSSNKIYSPKAKQFSPGSCCPGGPKQNEFSMKSNIKIEECRTVNNVQSLICDGQLKEAREVPKEQVDVLKTNMDSSFSHYRGVSTSPNAAETQSESFANEVLGHTKYSISQDGAEHQNIDKDFKSGWEEYASTMDRSHPAVPENWHS